MKVKRLACKSLKGRGANTGLRIIYAYFNDEQLIQFVEIYFKADQANEDQERIRRKYQKS